jgi:3-hydroxyisobutyrate dehydrogenase-like beta-hydroxyacid dehydrogenase
VVSEIRLFLVLPDSSPHYRNRNSEKCRPLGTLGATIAPSIADCVRDAQFVHLILAADDSVDSVMEEAAKHLAKGALVLDHTTTQPTRTAQRVKSLHEKGT